MLFPIKQLIEGRGEPLCARKNTTVREALTIMVEFDFSQLPIIDEQGNLLGMISENSIINTYFNINTAVSLLDLTVDHCMTSYQKITPDSDIFDALSLLDDVYAVIVVENQKPIGILTNYDTTNFFRDLTKGLIIVQDIEVSLRHYIESVFPNEKRMDAALMRAFKENKKNPTRPAKEYEDLSFGEHIQLIVTAQNWTKLQNYFKPKEMFIMLMQQVGDIRNQLSHFRGKLDPVQLSTLVTAQSWLSSRPKPIALMKEAVVEAEKINRGDFFKPAIGDQKSDGFYNWLVGHRTRGQTRIRLGIDQVEEMMGHALSDSAKNHPSWWINEPATHPQSGSWVSAGWMVEDVDLNSQIVTFKQKIPALQYTFFADTLVMLNSIRSGIVPPQKAPFANALSFSSGVAGLYFRWVLLKDRTFRVELHINKQKQAERNTAFEVLLDQKEEIEIEIGQELEWDKGSSRIYAAMLFYLSGPEEEQERAKCWGVEMMLKFVDVFKPRLREI
jgi:CBS domain-containing protein